MPLGEMGERIVLYSSGGEQQLPAAFMPSAFGTCFSKAHPTVAFSSPGRVISFPFDGLNSQFNEHGVRG